MFKFIHAADIHLDSPLRGLSRYETAPADSIRDACRKAFQNLVNLAIEEKAAFILVSGDLYDGDWKDYSTGIFLSQQISRLKQNNILVFAVSGNHDAASRLTKSLDLPSNMKVFSSRGVETVKLDSMSVAIHGRSFSTQHITDNFSHGFGVAEKGMFNIGMLHTSLDGREGHDVYAPCSLSDLISKGYQYWALGHIHKQEIVSEDPWIVFPGCIQGRHIRETEAKGCILVTVEDASVASVDKVPLDVFRWVVCKVDLSGVAKIPEVLERTRLAIQAELSSADGRPLAMRIRLEGGTPIAGELSSYPERLEQQIKALGAEIAGEDLWVERVENAAVGMLDLNSIISGDSALGELLKDILSMPSKPDEISGLWNVISELRQKMPPEAFGPESILDFGQEETIERLIREAKEMLIGRLLVTGGK